VLQKPVWQVWHSSPVEAALAVHPWASPGLSVQCP